MTSAIAAPIGAFEPSEVHIRLIVHDPSAISGLRLAACELRRQALYATDDRTSYACVSACNRALAVATAYEHFRWLSLQRETEVVQEIPYLCRDLYACFQDGLAAAPLMLDREFSTLFTLGAQGALGGRVDEAVEHSAADDGCAICFSLARDEAGEWVMAEEVEGSPIYIGEAVSTHHWLEYVQSTLRGWIGRLRPGSAQSPAPIRIAPAALSNSAGRA